MCFGPTRAGHTTFQGLDHNPHWAGIPDLDAAGRHAVEAYFRAYAPATADHVHYWLGEGLGAGRGAQADPVVVVPPSRRTLVTRKADLVVAGGVVSGTWSLEDDRIVVSWFAEAGQVPHEALAEEVARLAGILDRPLRATADRG